jgi:hypothetical protein
MLAAASAAMLPPIDFNDPLLGEPITDDTPMAFVQVGDNLRLHSKRMSIELSYDLPRFDDYVVAVPRMYCTLTFDVPPSQVLYNKFANGQTCLIMIEVPGSGVTFAGDFVLTDLYMFTTPIEELFTVTAERVNDGAARPLEIRVTT